MEIYMIRNVKLNQILPEQKQEIIAKLDKYGVVILSEVFGADESDNYVNRTFNWLTEYIPLLTRDPQTWQSQNLPSGPRRGMMQSIISHCPVAWELREHLYPLFTTLYDTPDLITSIDGGTFFPPVQIKTNDWPHIDQTKSEKDLFCIQGQVVLTQTTASFVCTPQSHLQHDRIIEQFNINRKNQWYKFKDDDINIIQSWFPQWQIPIIAPKGSIILWRSTTIHSARYVENPTIYHPLNSWDGWRCVYYICLRPKLYFTKKNLTTVRQAVNEGRTTNHWATKLFPKKQQYDSNKHPLVLKLLNDPTIIAPTTLTPIQQKITAFTQPQL